jgi:hypothetical protein
MSANKLLDPITPGEILREDFMEPLGISINQLVRDLSVPPNRIWLFGKHLMPCISGRLDNCKI